MRIRIDLDLCQGHGVCESEAPDVFSVSKQGELTVLQPVPSLDSHAAVRLAAKYCPTHAIILEES